MSKIELIPSPYQLANGKWVPRITKRVHASGKIIETKIDNYDEKFETERMVHEFVGAEIELLKIRD